MDGGDSTMARDAALDPGGWQRILDHHEELFADGDPRMRMALVPRHRADVDGVTRSVVQRTCAPQPMLLCSHDGVGMHATRAEFHGLDDLAADLLFVGNDGAFEAVLARDATQALGDMKRKIAAGAIQLFVLRAKAELRDLGYEDFLEALGLPFLGACR